MRQLGWLFLLGCGDAATPGADGATDTSAATDTPAATDTGPTPSTTPSPTTDPTPEPVSFARDIQPLFARTCGSGTSGCHDAEAYVAFPDLGCRGWLSLADQPMGDGGVCPLLGVYDRLLTLDAWSCGPVPEAPDAGGGTTKPYVVAGDPDASLLIQRITAQPLPCQDPFDTMPPLGSVSAEDLALLRRWITEGALDN